MGILATSLNSSGWSRRFILNREVSPVIRAGRGVAAGSPYGPYELAVYVAGIIGIVREGNRINNPKGLHATLSVHVDDISVSIAGKNGPSLVRASGELARELNEHIKSLLLARVGAAESPWYEALSKGDFKLVALCHEQEDATLGLAMCQLATVVGPASMTAELEETMEQIVATMRAGLEADAPPRYFTITMKRKAIGEEPSEPGDAAPAEGESHGEDSEESVESPAKRSRCSSSGREATVGVATDMEARGCETPVGKTPPPPPHLS